MKQRIVGVRPAQAPEGWHVYNAPRPLPGHVAWQGEFLHGIFYVAVNPDDGQYTIAFERECMTLDGYRTEWIAYATAHAELRAYYATEYGAEINVDAELAQFSEREITQIWARHFAYIDTEREAA